MYDTFTGYIKKSFKIIFQNKVLFVPLLINLLLVIIPIGLLFIIPGLQPPNIIYPPKGFMLAGFIIVGIIMLLLHLLISAGRLNMTKEAVLGNQPLMEHFWEGMKKYTGRIFQGGFMIFGGMLLLFLLLVPLGMALGRNVLILVVLLIPLLIVFVLISFWQIILVYEDFTPTESFKRSWNFTKKHFGLIVILNILRGLLTGNGNRNNNRNQSGWSINMNFINFNIPYMTNLGLIGTVSIILSAIKIFFTLYFDTLFFLVYHDRRKSILSNDEELEINNDYL